MNKQLVLCAAALSLTMCTAGTETDNPVTEFEASECKSHPTALTLGSEYDGFYCYGWETMESGALAIDVTNFSGGCHVMWALGESKVDGSRLELGIENPSCSIAGCGSCAYDFRFEVTGVDTSQPLTAQLRERDCRGEAQPDPEPSVILPIDTRPTGLLCRPRRGWDFETGCGGAHLPPCDPDQLATSACDRGECDEDLTCADEDSGARCFASCETDDDCTLDIDSCQDGLCRLRETF